MVEAGKVWHPQSCCKPEGSGWSRLGGVQRHGANRRRAHKDGAHRLGAHKTQGVVWGVTDNRKQRPGRRDLGRRPVKHQLRAHRPRHTDLACTDRDADLGRTDTGLTDPDTSTWAAQTDYRLGAQRPGTHGPRCTGLGADLDTQTGAQRPRCTDEGCVNPDTETWDAQTQTTDWGRKDSNAQTGCTDLGVHKLGIHRPRRRDSGCTEPPGGTNLGHTDTGAQIPDAASARPRRPRAPSY